MGELLTRSDGTDESLSEGRQAAGRGLTMTQ